MNEKQLLSIMCFELGSNIRKLIKDPELSYKQKDRIMGEMLDNIKIVYRSPV